ncbi:MAG: ABC transporter permease subunit [Planctomycetes bacterium]|nr:ABC transporter permease subunit [Planctomycetota bacterium]
MINKLFTVAKNTFTETLRQPVYSVILAFALFLFILSPSITMYSLDEDIKLLREIGLSTLFITGLFIAIFSAASAVTEEIESKTITTVLSKPIGRPTFIFGKFLGVSAAVALAHYICSIAYLMIVRHGVLETASDTHDWPVITVAAFALLLAFLLTAFLNYSYDWNFLSTMVKAVAILGTVGLIILSIFDKEWHFNPGDNHIEIFDINAAVLLLLAVILLVSLAVMFSTRFNVVLTLVFCVGAFLMGLISDFVFSRNADEHWWAKVGEVVTPNLQVFWISDAIYEGSDIPASYIIDSGVYTAFYAGAILLLAIAMFQKRQVG